MKQNGSIRKRTLNVKSLVSYLLPVIIFSLALWTLDKQMHNLRSSYILKNIASIPMSHVGIADF